jgi:hypothetical protein
MTQTGKDEAEDRGFPFLVVRMLMPSSTAIENLAPEMQALAQANIERARRIFRSRTLPLPRSDARLFADPFWLVGSLSKELDDVFLEGIHDQATIAAIALPPPNWKGELPTADEDPGLRVEILRGDNRLLKLQHAATLLGKYWYRHQEMDIFDAAKMLRDLEAARQRGESGSDILHRSKPPAPPRRVK